MVSKTIGTILKMIAVFMLGGLVGYASLQVVTRQPPPDEQLPFVAPQPADPDFYVNMQEAIDDPGGYSEREMMFRGYLGIHNDRIAIFQGTPPDGVLQDITEYEVRDDLRPQLEEGVPFEDIQEMLSLLENYTS
ncbi:BofC C-terminal domain-containing protein [Dethiobacter alkaliphilus]|uniref:BofC C-terminal domain-containing protein n=1 Tax=Dethiobacter alkaliphilus TaxID=427926 RepID=UPI0022279604|nr:BofC C-terminal domain-containing protein [Dethiobacter alkaliphilus]MCW3490416.1 BofC C-terminal domain-containing protein [Dethiobacter alkaliphilus]